MVYEKYLINNIFYVQTINILMCFWTSPLMFNDNQTGATHSTIICNNSQLSVVPTKSTTQVPISPFLGMGIPTFCIPLNDYSLLPFCWLCNR